MFLIRFYNKLTPFKRVLIALFLGIALGIIIGEPAGKLEILGNAYIRLLQMTVLPYILVSIIGGLGHLDGNMASRIGMKALRIIVIVWLAVMLTLTLFPLAYPDWVTSGFFSTSLVTPPTQFNFVDLYIPSNIFSSLANTVVPAVVLFSLLMGISLISIKNKDTLISLTNSLGDTLMGVASFVAKLAPLGIFAISISAAGTLEPAELGRLQVFLWVYLVGAALLAFLFLPLILHWATPFSYRQVMSVAGEAAITALATGTVLVVLPMIIERCKELLAEQDMDCDESLSTVDVIVPTAYSFPSTGTLLGLGFILFSAWYVGSPLSVYDYPSFITMGALTAFGSMAVAIPFMLDFFGLPADQFQLYLLGSVVTARVATGLAALHGFIVTLLVASAVIRKLKWHYLFQAIGVHLAVTFGVMLLLGQALTHLIPYEYEGTKSFESMRLLNEPVKLKQVKEFAPLSQEQLSKSRLNVITERGVLRVGYFSNTLPYAFRNNKAELVGLDVEIINELAKDLKVNIEYVHIKRLGQEIKMLQDGQIDMVIGGHPVTPSGAKEAIYSHPYMHNTAGLVIKDQFRDQFSTLAKIQERKKLTLAVPDYDYYLRVSKDFFPNAEIIPLTNTREYFKGKFKNVDALLFSVEIGSTWGIIYPDYTALVPQGLKFKVPIAFKLPKNQFDWVFYINNWLTLKADGSFIERSYQYWIMGNNPKKKEPRWSVLRNVMGWDI